MLTIHQLEVFVTVANQGSVRRAAEQLVVTQPAVSASLAALERAVGAPLVRRVGRTIELTEAGRRLDSYARQILALVTEAVEAVRPGAHPPTAPVRLGVSSASVDHVVTPFLARRHDSSGPLSVEVGNRARIWHLLAEREIDAAVCGRPPVTGRFVSIATRPADWVVVARPGTVWPGRIGTATWLAREDGSGSRALTDEVLAQLGLRPPVVVIGANSAIQRSVESGLGVALLPADSVAEAVRTRALVVVHTDATPMCRPWHLVVRADEPLSEGCRRLVRELLATDAGWTPTGAAGTALGEG